MLGPSSMLPSQSWLHSIYTLITLHICSCFRCRLHLPLGWEFPYGTDYTLFILGLQHLTLFLAWSKLSAAWSESIHIIQGPDLAPGTCKAELLPGVHSAPSLQYLCGSDKGREGCFNLEIPGDQQEFHAFTPGVSFCSESANGLCRLEEDVCQARM